MAHETRQVAGYQVNLLTSKDGNKIRHAVVLVGPENAPGWRSKDGTEARQRRREAKRAVMEKLGLAPYERGNKLRVLPIDWFYE